MVQFVEYFFFFMSFLLGKKAHRFTIVNQTNVTFSFYYLYIWLHVKRKTRMWLYIHNWFLSERAWRMISTFQILCSFIQVFLLEWKLDHIMISECMHRWTYLLSDWVQECVCMSTIVPFMFDLVKKEKDRSNDMLRIMLQCVSAIYLSFSSRIGQILFEWLWNDLNMIIFGDHRWMYRFLVKCLCIPYTYMHLKMYSCRYWQVISEASFIDEWKSDDIKWDLKTSVWTT
jgi:hypothetical protein